jgi:hypothetical protein
MRKRISSRVAKIIGHGIFMEVSESNGLHSAKLHDPTLKSDLGIPFFVGYSALWFIFVLVI